LTDNCEPSYPLRRCPGRPVAVMADTASIDPISLIRLVLSLLVPGKGTGVQRIAVTGVPHPVTTRRRRGTRRRVTRNKRLLGRSAGGTRGRRLSRLHRWSGFDAA